MKKPRKVIFPYTKKVVIKKLTLPKMNVNLKCYPFNFLIARKNETKLNSWVW